MTKENPSIAAFKVWVFPSLVSLVSLLIWNDVNEIKADVKLLMAQSNIDKTRIDNVEREIYKKSASNPIAPFKDDEPKANHYAILTNTKLSKYDF
jgi:hypothetical protein